MNSSNIPLVRRILGFMVIPRTDGDGFGEYTSPKMLEALLSLAKGSVYIILADLRSLIGMDGDYSEPMKFFHASGSSRPFATSLLGWSKLGLFCCGQVRRGRLLVS